MAGALTYRTAGAMSSVSTRPQAQAAAGRVPETTPGRAAGTAEGRVAVTAANIPAETVDARNPAGKTSAQHPASPAATTTPTHPAAPAATAADLAASAHPADAAATEAAASATGTTAAAGAFVPAVPTAKTAKAATGTDAAAGADMQNRSVCEDSSGAFAPEAKPLPPVSEPHCSERPIFPLSASADSPDDAADSLHAAAAHPPFWRDTTAQAVFGQQSVLVVPQRIPLRGSDSLTENAVFQSFVLLLAVTYALLIYRNLGDVTMLLGRISRDTASGKRLSEDPGGSGFPRFLNIATAIGMLFMGVVVVKYGDSLMPRALTDMFSHGAVLALSLLATLACVAVVCFQLAALRIAGAVMLSQPFISQLVLLKRTYFSLAVIVTSPALLLFALCPRGTGSVWFVVVAAELAITAVLYLREALNLFLSKKISILHWFLYLCTVEVFPISLLWLLAAR